MEGEAFNPAFLVIVSLFLSAGLMQYSSLCDCHWTPHALTSDGNEIQFRSDNCLFVIF